jgi:hypothetical protein
MTCARAHTRTHAHTHAHTHTHTHIHTHTQSRAHWLKEAEHCARNLRISRSSSSMLPVPCAPDLHTRTAGTFSTSEGRPYFSSRMATRCVTQSLSSKQQRPTCVSANRAQRAPPLTRGVQADVHERQPHTAHLPSFAACAPQLLPTRATTHTLALPKPTHSLTHSPTTHSLTHSPTHSLTHPPTQHYTPHLHTVAPRSRSHWQRVCLSAAWSIWLTKW